MYEKSSGNGEFLHPFPTAVKLSFCHFLPCCIYRIGVAAAGVAEGGDAFRKCCSVRQKFALKYLLAVYE